MRVAIRAAARFVSSPAFSGYIVAPFGGLANFSLSSDEALDAYIRENTGTSAHPVGTAAMSARNAEYGVVDPDLKVKGVEGLRVVDASVLVGFHSMPFWICIG